MFWKKKKNKKAEFICSECGQVHSEWPALTFNSPTNYDFLSEEDKVALGRINSDFCEIDFEEGTGLFIRVVLTQKVNGFCENLDYGLWVSLSEKSYSDYKTNFNNENHEAGYFGWLCSMIPEYDDTMSIPCNVITKTGNSRPEIFPHQDFDHPFVRDYYNGITKEEAEKRINNMLKKV
ncbi:MULTISPECIES: DUF2199 domain-containing protein [unclassified Tenacibaculum]|uniref:DUF2199 domain-containing protein n=1 Tax=unclassified Tenacibaculum TaxID=2635139 RepID=UPI001F1E457C|nr:MULTISPECIES: DUF2199 domain-containing protein [unclassified Tenacibaculum]MCF2875556.1 DUF2199 domain-containing protein [Tenacibaculum sp. Cn5-1]MCF2935632.1 DUF2199 domain-containing protein [Tenacibaculum sp. Cn5-34]MCG7512192.1 DUF2199 domain-containing protein [Tenacibaculum sp. Cn5-46]